MALLAKQRWSLGQHGGMIAAVHIVAKRTRFGDRSMLPQVGAALIGMTAIAGVIDIVFGQQVIVVAVMHVVAITAFHASKAQGMTGCLVRILACPGVAAETDFLLLERIKHRITIGMRLVAGSTTHIHTFMAAAEPTGAGMAFMTTQTSRVLLRDRRVTALSENNWHRYFRLFSGLLMFL